MRYSNWLRVWLPVIAGMGVCPLGQHGSAQEPKQRATLIGHTANVSSLAFSADGRKLVSGSYDATIKLWDMATGKELATFKDRPVRAVAITADSKTLASGSRDGVITLWDVATGKQQSTFKADPEAIRSLVFSTDGKTLVSGAGNGMVKVWDVATSKERATLKRHSWRVTTVRFSADDKVLASASSHAVTLADMGTLKERYALNANDEPNTLVSIAFTSDNNTLATGSKAGKIKLWSVATGKVLASLPDHKGCGALAFSADGKTLASASIDGTIKWWDVATGKEQATLKVAHGALVRLMFSPDGKVLASVNENNEKWTIQLWDVPKKPR